MKKKVFWLNDLFFNKFLKIIPIFVENKHSFMEKYHIKNFVIIVLLCTSIHVFSQYPTVYDLRTLGMITPVKDQGLSCGSCWAFASCSAIESQWLVQGYGTYDLSEDNLMDCHGFDEAPCAGGSYYMTQATLSLHRGILSEVDDPYTPATSNCPMNLTFPPLPQAYVEDMIFIPSVINNVKQAVLSYGAVASTMFFNSSNYNSSSYKYYDSFIDSNDSLYAHCITIAGWNDTMSFSGAPGLGGWIIKDSYGTSWAQNGYFYCSFYDAGILGENVIFPVRQQLTAVQNKPHVYAHDELGWVDNTGFSSNIGYGLVKYTLTPAWGIFAHQQIKRIGTYAVVDNTSIEISLWREKNGNILTGFIDSKTIQCDFKGFYTVPFELKTDTLLSDIYVKVRYTCPAGTQNPIPIEILEAGHTSGISISTNSCWTSADGNNWSLIGNGTSQMYDLCIKMYTENAPLAIMDQLPDSVCEGEMLILNDISPNPKDSCHWYINGTYLDNVPNTPYNFTSLGLTEVSLVVWLGNNTDTLKHNIQVVERPAVPVISQTYNTLESTAAHAYQWLDDMLNIISGANNQTFDPPAEGFYSVIVNNSFGCESLSAPFNFLFAGIIEQNDNSFMLFPNPAQDFLTISSKLAGQIVSITINDLTGKTIINLNVYVEANKPITIDCQLFNTGLYFITIEANDLQWRGKFLIE